MSKKWLRPLFRVFARGCMHAFGAHLPLEKCKKPRTGRGFLRIYRGRADSPFRYIGFSKRQASHSGGLFCVLCVGGKVRRPRKGQGMIGLEKSVCCQGCRAWGDAQGAEGSEAIGHLGGNNGTALLIKQKTQWVMKKANAPDTPKEKDMKKAKGTRNPLHPPCRGDASAFRAAGPVSGRPYFLCFSASGRPGAGAQYDCPGTGPG